LPAIPKNACPEFRFSLSTPPRISNLLKLHIQQDLPAEFPDNLARGGDDRSGDIEALQKQCEILKVNAAQVFVACQQHPAIEQGGFRKHKGIIALRDRKQIPMADGVGNPFYNSEFNRNEIDWLEFPKGAELREHGFRDLAFPGRLAVQGVVGDFMQGGRWDDKPHALYTPANRGYGIDHRFNVRGQVKENVRINGDEHGPRRSPGRKWRALRKP